MEFKKFVERVMEELPNKLRNELASATVREAEVNKLQGESYCGISILPKDSEIAVTVNLKGFHEMYESGGAFGAVLESIASSAIKGYQNRVDVVSQEMLAHYDQVKPLLTVQVVGIENNEEMLKKIPHKRLLDMAIVYRIELDSSTEGLMTVLVTNQVLEGYKITPEQLHEDAMSAVVESHPYVFQPITDTLNDMGVSDIPKDESGMSVVTNATRMYGAAVITYPNFMENMKEKMGGDFFLLPSSVHEVLILPDNGEYSARVLEAMVTDINASALSPEEKLTDSAYHYDCQDKIFELAGTYEKRMKEKERTKSASVLKNLENKKQENMRRSTREPCRAEGHDSFAL